MRLLVCGSRDWSDRDLLESVLDIEWREAGYDGLTIVEGEASGADRLAREWADRNDVAVDPFPADWSVKPDTPPSAIRHRRDGTPYDVRAGHQRNAAMLASGVDGVFAFSTSYPATPGTAGMCRLAFNAGLVVVFFTPDGRERKYVIE